MASLRSQVPRPESDSERRDASTDGSLNLTASTFELGFLVGAKGSSGGFMCASSFAAEALDNPELEPGCVRIERCLRLLWCIWLSADRRLSLANPLQHSSLFRQELLRAGS